TRVPHPDIADAVAAIHRIDHAATADARQHEGAPGATASPDCSADVILTIACATESTGLWRVAATAASAPRVRLRSTPSWSTPGRPTAIRTRGGRGKPASGAVSAIIGTSCSQSGFADP